MNEFVNVNTRGITNTTAKMISQRFILLLVLKTTPN